MIRLRDDDPSALPAVAPPSSRLPWRSAEPWLERLAFACLWAGGPDPARDRVFRWRLARRTDEGWEELTLGASPFEESASPERVESLTKHLQQDFGLRRSDLENALPSMEAWGLAAEFLADRTLITADRASFLDWCDAQGRGAPSERVLDLAQLTALFAPGRLASSGEGLVGQLLGGREAPSPARALDPWHLRRALDGLVARVLEAGAAPLAVLTHSLESTWSALRGSHPAAADELALALALVERPSAWRGDDDTLFPSVELRDGCLTAAVTEYPYLEDALDATVPPWARMPAGAPKRENLAATVQGEPTLDADDRRRVDEAFQIHLPRLLAERRGGKAEDSYRPGQHAVAARIAEGFGQRELRLIHAPTGTGKTLAYLVPVLLWAQRNGVRVAVATYTRALQEQAMEREVPLALEVLRRVGCEGLHVNVLKGRNNYLCWRAFLLQIPASEEEDGLEQLAWALLGRFALTDLEGDLDRLALRKPLGTIRDLDWRQALERLLRLVRSETGCCTLPGDRSSCGAEAARRRAEKSHLVVTNHAFALARREFFRLLVFDECEHLHDVAHNAFSHAIGLKSVRELLGRMYGSDGRRPLNRIAALTPPGSEAALLVRGCVEARLLAAESIEGLRDALHVFKDWRDARRRARIDADDHSLFREYVHEEEDAEPLLAAHDDLRNGLNRLSGGLAQISEVLETSIPPRELSRLRRTLEVLRADLDETLAGVGAWIPRRDDGRPSFRPETFYDVERALSGDDVLAARVLLPHEYLGRHYYPDLHGAVLLSATTWLKDGFEVAATYLGVTRAADPDPEEDRAPTVVHTFRAPESFDYGRVLVSVPRDGPPVTDKAAFLDYAARFLRFLAERTRGRVLALFTNADDLASVGRSLEPFFKERRLPLFWQRMKGTTKEELSELFRSHPESTLLGLDTFWYGADFPGPTLEYLVMVRLPYGVPDRYHHAQCAALGAAEQRRQIYMPRALAKFRQGFGRLMRRDSDRGVVFVLDKRFLEPRHRGFLRELPVRGTFAPTDPSEKLASLVVGDTDRCLGQAFAHMGLKAEIERRGLGGSFGA